MDLSHQAVLSSDPKTIQQIEIIYKLAVNVTADILKSKE